MWPRSPCYNIKQCSQDLLVITMLRQRTVGRGEEDASEGIFIGDVEEPSRSLKDKTSVQSENSCWKYVSLFLIIVAGDN